MEDYEHETVDLWPENQSAISLFSSVSTQWRVGAMGPTGLDYNVLFICMGRMRLSDAEYDQLFEDMRVVEAEALALMTKTE